MFAFGAVADAMGCDTAAATDVFAFVLSGRSAFAPVLAEL